MTIYATCGHVLAEDELGELVMLATTDCESYGFNPCVETGCYCASCAADLRKQPEYLSTIEQAYAYLEARWKPGDKWP